VARVQVGSAIMGAARGKVTAMEREREREREREDRKEGFNSLRKCGNHRKT